MDPMDPQPGRHSSGTVPVAAKLNEERGSSQASPDLLAEYSPPFDLTADMLFVMAAVPTRPMRQTFPRVPFLSMLGNTPLVIWFSRITEACYGVGAGERHCDGGPGTL